MFFNSTMPSPFSLNEQNGGVLVKSTNSVIKMTWCTHERHNGWICHILFAKNSTVGIAIVYITGSTINSQCCYISQKFASFSFKLKIHILFRIPKLIICGLINSNYMIGLDSWISKIEVLYIHICGLDSPHCYLTKQSIFDLNHNFIPR